MTSKLPWAAVSPRVETKREIEVIARRKTYDGKDFLLWSDGSVTKPFGFYWEGTRKLPVRVGLVVSHEVCLFTEEEVPLLLKAAKQLSKKGSFDPGELRTLAHRLIDKAKKPQRVKPVWEVISADRDGKPTERVWRLPRLRWPGLAVWDFGGGRDSSGGRYVLYRATYRSPVGRRGGEPAWESTGIRFKNLAELTAHLESIR